MNTTQNFALIDNASGYIWWIGKADSPESACAAATMESASESASYEPTHQLALNESGYLVHAAPEGFDVDDGQDKDQIAAVSALPFVGRFRRVGDE